MRNLRRTACLEREQFTLLMIVKKTKNLKDAVRKEKRGEKLQQFLGFVDMNTDI